MTEKYRSAPAASRPGHSSYSSFGAFSDPDGNVAAAGSHRPMTRAAGHGEHEKRNGHADADRPD
jgi:hypothetical protein